MNIAPAAGAVIAATVGMVIVGCASGAAVELNSASEIGIARGGVIRDDLARSASERSIRQAVESRNWTRDALREFHASRMTQAPARSAWNTEVLRELKGSDTQSPTESRFTAEVMRELKGDAPRSVEHGLTGDELRELKGSRPEEGRTP